MATPGVAAVSRSVNFRPLTSAIRNTSIRRSSSRLQKKQGVWVFSTGKPMASDETAEALRDIREQRDRKNAGDIE
jgi:hypothetical protein